MMCVFFVSVGMLLDVETVRHAPWAVLGLFAGITVVKAIAATAAAVVLRFPVRVAALAGAALAQVGEFSFVLAASAEGAGLLTVQESRLFLAASVLSIAVAPLAVALSPRLLAGTSLLRPLERLLDSQGVEVPVVPPVTLQDHVIIAGLGVGGRTVVSALERVGIKAVIIELNPETVIAETERGRLVVYGDVTSHEVLSYAGIHTAKALVLVISDYHASKRALDVAAEMRPDLPVVTRTRFASEEAAERARGMVVTSEEFAGAVALAGLVLRRCGVQSWSRVVTTLVGEHERLGPEDEGSLGAPPSDQAAQLLALRTQSPPPDRAAAPPGLPDES
jgi:CPA2 family monovalent cation:H+ antiporter-2